MRASAVAAEAAVSSGRELLATAIEAHGGAERWNAVHKLTAHIRSGGIVKWWGTKRWIPTAYETKIWPDELRIEISPFAGRERRGVFTGKAVRIEERDGTVVGERATPRKGSIRRLVSWNRLDALYFGGYTYWNYVCFPFLLMRPGVRVHELDPWVVRGERFRRLHAVFPADTPTHSREQVFFFDGNLLLRRYDYRLERLGGWAKGAHYLANYRDFSGLLVSTKRWVRMRVVPRYPLLWPRFYWMSLDHLGVEYAQTDARPLDGATGSGASAMG